MGSQQQRLHQHYDDDLGVCWAQPPGTIGLDDLPLSRSQGPGPVFGPRFEAARELPDAGSAPSGLSITLVPKQKLLATARDVAAHSGEVMDSVSLARALQEFRGNGGVLREFRGGHYYTKVTPGGQEKIILRGAAGKRPTLTGTRYGVGHSKIVNMPIGMRGWLKSGVRGGALTFVLVASAEVAQHLASPDSDGIDFTVKLFSDLTKVGIGTASATGAAVLVGTLVAGSVVLPIVASIGASLLVGWVLDEIDESLGITDSVNRWVHQQVAELDRQIQEATWEVRRSYRALQTPEGILWLQQRLLGF